MYINFNFLYKLDYYIICVIFKFTNNLLGSGNPCVASNENINEEKTSNEGNKDSNNVSDTGDEWYTKQVPVSEDICLVQSPKYGFANKISGALSAFEVSKIRKK
jgi:hypothetical protein